MPPPLVFILLDAFRWDYLTPEGTPLLWEMRERGLYVRKLRPSFGYCEHTEYATGARPNVSGNFAQITCARPRPPVHLRAYMRLLEAAEKALRCYNGRGSTRMRRWVGRDLVAPLLRDPGVLDLRYRIPLRMLPLLTATEAARYTRPGAFSLESVFDRLHARGSRIFDDTFVIYNRVAGSDEARVDNLIARIPDACDLYMIYLGECDGAGHIYGPGSPQIRDAAAAMDRHVRRLTRAFSDAARPHRFLTVGDHGMLPVDSSVDVLGAVRAAARRAGLRADRDYALFLDSTLARFWFNTDRARKCISGQFERPPMSQAGVLLTEAEAARLHVPPPGDRYGHLIWRANPGTMIFPDYFNREVQKGMHGYPTHIDGQKGMALLWGEGISTGTVEQADLIDLCPTLCDLFEVSPPEKNQGRSLLERR